MYCTMNPTFSMKAAVRRTFVIRYLLSKLSKEERDRAEANAQAGRPWKPLHSGYVVKRFPVGKNALKAAPLDFAVSNLPY